MFQKALHFLWFRYSWIYWHLFHDLIHLLSWTFVHWRMPIFVIGWNVVPMFVMSAWLIVLYKSSFIIADLLFSYSNIIDNGVLKSPTTVVELSIFPSILSVCFKYLWISVLDTYIFVTVVSSFLVNHFVLIKLSCCL